jgi:hypothetical protein
MGSCIWLSKSVRDLQEDAPTPCFEIYRLRKTRAIGGTDFKVSVAALLRMYVPKRPPTPSENAGLT